VSRERRIERWALVGLFLLALLPRAIYPVSRPLQWYFRSAEFFQAVLEGDWAGTIFSEHPGVTVMWLSGAATWGWYGLQSLLGLNPPTPLETEGYAFVDRVAVGVLPLALAVALGIVGGWYLLRRLFGPRVAWVAAILWACDPFYLANSKMLHLDAILSTSMVLSALWMLIYVRERKWRQLVYSALLGGIAVLTKVSAVFLVPFLGLALLVDWLSSWRLRRPMESLKSAAAGLLLWLVVAVTICFALWPSMWVQPGESVDRVVTQGVLMHVDMPRDQPLFYRGALGVQDPGIGFYADVLLYRSTFLSLPFAIVGLLAASIGRSEERKSLFLLLGFGFFYLIQMSLGSWKDGRYLLPIFLLLDVLAAVGLLHWVEGIWRSKGVRCWLAVGLLLVLQAGLVLRHHPYYGNHYNVLGGGLRAVMRVFPPGDYAEGVDLAGQYVDDLPGADGFVVGTQFLANEMLTQHVRAPVHDISQVGMSADYLVFGVQYTMRGQGYSRWGELWEQFKFREPEFVASFGGTPYAWVHRPGADPIIPHQTDVRVGNAIQLLGYRLAHESVAPGDKLLLTLYWAADELVEADYTVFTHLLGPDGGLVAQQDNPPVRGTRPTSSWDAGELVEDTYEIPLPADLATGDYRLNVGMYRWDTLERLEVLDGEGVRLPDDQMVLTSLQVGQIVPWWRWMLRCR
jgi:hypothetical protein